MFHAVFSVIKYFKHDLLFLVIFILMHGMGIMELVFKKYQLQFTSTLIVDGQCWPFSTFFYSNYISTKNLLQ